MIAGVRVGRVLSAANDVVTTTLPRAVVGDGVSIRSHGGNRIAAVVTGIDADRVRLAAFAPLAGVAVGDPVESDARANVVPLGVQVLGRAIDAAGHAIDGRPDPAGRPANVLPRPIDAAARAPVTQALWTGIRAIDGLLTIGRGARVGIFGAPAAGKSTLIEMLVAGARADAVVIALVGERGREAQRWIARIAPHATIVCAPSDRSATERMRAAHVAIAQGHELRRRGLNVLAIIDSVARFCSAARELAVANGETVGRGGYPPSVFNEMARLLERGGNVGGGSLTVLATVLSDGGDEREPLSDAARSLLDGHIVLSTALARSGHYPAIDVLASASRTMSEVTDEAHRSAAQAVVRGLALLEETRDARELGLARGTPALDRALAARARLDAFLRQRDPAASPPQTFAELAALARELEAA